MSGVDAVNLARAYAFAASAHADQRRKGRARIPYVNHCCEVAELVAEAGAPVETIVAAVLHDVIEDSEATEAEIAERFGAMVATRVTALTDPPDWDDLPRRERKTRQAQRIRGGA